MAEVKKAYLRIGHQNIHGLDYSKKGELLNAIKSRELDILSLNETLSKEICAIPGYQKIEMHRLAANGQVRSGVAIYFREELRVVETKPPDRQPIGTEIIAVTIQNPTTREKLTYAVVYNHPWIPLDEEVMQNLVENNQRVVFGGDFNAHHEDLGSTRTNSSGRRLKSFLMETGYVILNDNQATHFPESLAHQPSRIDLFLAEAHTLADFSNFGTNQDIRSDHMMVTIEAVWEHNIKKDKIVRDYSNADWDMFRSLISLGIEPEPIETREDVDQAIQQLTTTIAEAAETAIPNKKVPNIRDWLSFSTKTLIRKRNKSRKNWQRYRLEEFRRKTRELDRKVRIAVARDKVRFFDRFRKIIEKRPDQKQFWNAMRIITGSGKKWKKVGFMIEGKLITDPSEVAEAYVEYMAEICQEPEEPDGTDLTNEFIQNFEDERPEVYHPDHEAFFIEHEEDEAKLNLGEEIANGEVEWAIKYTPNKSPGLDKVDALLVQKAGQTAFFRICEIFNAALRMGYFPAAWKIAVIVVILKPGKDPTSIGSYRPISLLNVLGKIFEKIVSRRLSNHLEATNFFSDSQNGFRRRRETTDALFKLQQDLMKGTVFPRLYSGILMFDAEKAFDKTWTKGLIYKIIEANLFPTLINRLLASYFADRKICVRIENEISAVKTITAGTPQGSVLSPLLFIIGINDFEEKTRVDLVSNSQFADDISKWIIGKQKRIVRNRLQQAVQKMGEYSKTWRVKFNPGKTHFLVVTRRKGPSGIRILMNGEELRETTSAKYLGVTFQKDAGSAMHVKEIRKKAGQRLGYLTSLARGGIVPEKTIIQAYKAYIRPIIEYGYPAWCGGVSQTSLLGLERIQRKALKTAMRLPIWTPTGYLYGQTTVEPLLERLKSVGQRYLERKPDLNPVNAEHPLKRLNFPGRVLAN